MLAQISLSSNAASVLVETQEYSAAVFGSAIPGTLVDGDYGIGFTGTYFSQGNLNFTADFQNA